jgi:hypothetical protein
LLSNHIRSADADVGNASPNELGDRAERLNVEVQSHGRKFRFKCLHGVGEPSGWQHHIDSERDLGSKRVSKALTLARRSPTPSATARTFDSTMVPAVKTRFRVRARSH